MKEPKLTGNETVLYDVAVAGWIKAFALGVCIGGISAGTIALLAYWFLTHAPTT